MKKLNNIKKKYPSEKAIVSISGQASRPGKISALILVFLIIGCSKSLILAGPVVIRNEDNIQKNALAEKSPQADPSSKRASLEDKIEAWLRQLPAQNQTEAERVFSEMLKAGPPVVDALCQHLEASGKTDDSLVRYALDGMITLSGHPEYEIYQERLAADILSSARNSKSVEIKKFLLQEVELIISSRHLKLIRPFLKNPALTEATVRAMLKVKSPEVEKILAKDFKSLRPESQIPVIQAFGILRSTKAVPILKKLALSDDLEIKILSLKALVEIPEPSVEPLLSSIPTLATKEERRQILELYLRFARRLAETGRKDLARRLAEKSFAALKAKDEAPLRCEALNILVEVAGEKSIPEIIKAIWDDEPAVRAHASSLAQAHPWPELIKTLEESLDSFPPEKRAPVIEFFGELGDRSQAEKTQLFLEAPEESVRLSAIRAFYSLRKEEAMQFLLPMIKNSEAEAELVLSLLKSQPPENYLGEVRAIYPQLQDSTRIVVLESLGDFISAEWKEDILGDIEASDPDLKKAALNSLLLVVEAGDLDWLVDKYIALEDSTLAISYQKAITASINKITDAMERQKAFLRLVEKISGKPQAELIRLLPLVGGSECWKKVLEAMNSKNPEISGAAIVALSNWPEFEAAPYLVNLIKMSGDRRFRYLAFQGLSRLVKETAADKEEKLNLLQEIKSLVEYPDERNFLMLSWAAIRDVRALEELSGFFADENLGERARLLACRLARPVAGEEGLKGMKTIMVLKKALPLLEDSLEIEETELYLDQLLKEEGFVQLFNGKDLFGWKGLVEDPVKRAKMSYTELAAAQKKADEIMRQHWQLIDGVLVFDGQGHSLCTAKDYCDFELFVDWKIESGGDSGLYLRGSPQVQIWDPAQWPEGSGGLYNNQKNPNKPLKCADNPVGSWNTFYIKMVGEKVTVYLNCELVVDNVVMENYWERDKLIYPCGQIELQAHNTPLYFKNIYIRELERARLVESDNQND